MNEVFVCFEFHDGGIGNYSGEWKLIKVCKNEQDAIDFVGLLSPSIKGMILMKDIL